MAKASPAAGKAREVNAHGRVPNGARPFEGVPSAASTEVDRANNPATCFGPCERELCGLEKEST